MKYRGCLGFAGLGSLAVSLFFVAASVVGMFTPGERLDVMVGMAVFFGIISIGGGIATYLGFRKQVDKAMDPRAIEQTVLGVARDLNGEVTVEELALATPLTVAEGKVALGSRSI